MSEIFPYQELENRIINIINSQSDVNNMLTTIAQELGKIFAVDTCLIIPKNQENSENNIFVWSINNQLIAENLPIFSLSDIQNLSLITINNIQESEFHNLFVHFNLSALLVFNNGINGVIILGKNNPYQWRENEQNFLNQIANIVAIALRLYHTENEAKLSYQYETLIREIGVTLLQTSSLDSLYNLSLEAILKALEIKEGLILTLKYNNPLFKRLGNEEKPQGKAEIVSCHKNINNTKKSPQKSVFKLSESELILKALEIAPQSFAINNVSNYSDLLTLNPKIIFDKNITKSLLFVPIMGSMKSEARTPIILGLIILQHDKIRPWSTQEIQLVNWVSIQLSINILHNQSLSRVQALVDERTSQLKWSLDVQAKLSEKMRQQLEELQQLNKIKDDFLSSISHELNTPLTTMKIAIKMLRQPYCTPEKQAKYLDILEQEWNREYSLIKDLLTLQQVESNNLNITPQKVSLKEIIEKISQDFEKKWSGNKGLNLRVKYDYSHQKTQNLDDIFQVYIDPHTLEQIIGELLLNAGKYADPETEVLLILSRKIDREGYKILITVTNYGWGISPDEKRYIFDKFRRGKGVTDSAIQGTGLGLTMVKSLVDHLEGIIEVSSVQLENSASFLTSFTVTLPQSF